MLNGIQLFCRKLFRALYRRAGRYRSLRKGDAIIGRFIRHNKTYWAATPSRQLTGEVLFEFTTMEPSIVAYSYFANVLSRKHGAKAKSYIFNEGYVIDRLVQYLYESFNVPIFFCSLDKKQKDEAIALYKTVYSKLGNKKDVFDLEIMGIYIGDLIYDYHLKTYTVPTVDINDSAFHDSLKRGLSYFIFWRDYLKHHNVKAVNVTHCAYLLAIPLRIAVNYGITAYQCNAHGCYRLSAHRLWAYTEFYDYPSRFRQFGQDQRQEMLKFSKQNIARRFGGEVGVDMHYSTKSAYSSHRLPNVIRSGDKLKVLVAAHCFFDSPNGLGKNLFIDFYEWFHCLGKISEKTDYDWYIKTHPDSLPGNVPILRELSEQYPEFTLIPKETSHHQLIEEGIDVALTVYGTIGLEYAALGKLVVNASVANPHIAYDFNLHPRTLEEYENVLMDLENQEIHIPINQVHEYYGMKNSPDGMDNWLFKNYQEMWETIGYREHFSPISYQYFLDQFRRFDHERRIQLLENFTESGDYFMNLDHG